MTSKQTTNARGSQELGTLKVRIDSDSHYFKSNIPVRIRNSRMKVLKLPREQREFKLSPGVYQVSAVLEDGQEHKQVVRIKEGEVANVEMGANNEKASIKAHRRSTKRMRVQSKAPRYTKTIERLAAHDDLPMSSGAEAPIPGKEIDPQEPHTNSPEPHSNSPEPSTNGHESSRPHSTGDKPSKTKSALLALSGAFRVDGRENPWMLNCESNVEQVPTATVEISSNAGSQRYTISLPTSPHDTPDYNSCVVVIEKRFSKLFPAAWISPSRTVANALQNMLAANQLHTAKDFADNATELLRSKYQDPTGATLGALVMHKFGILEEKQSWLENLARDFRWIPDAKILLASTMVHSVDQTRETHSRAFKIAIEASQQRILYTECYSILLDLLRRWPDKRDNLARKKAIAHLAKQSPYIDWNSICMSQRTED